MTAVQNETVKADTQKKNILYMGIGCIPGTTQPDVYIERAINILGLRDAPEADTKSVDVRQWYIPCDLSKEQYDAKKDELCAYLTDLTNGGYIRFAEWYFNEAK